MVSRIQLDARKMTNISIKEGINILCFQEIGTMPSSTLPRRLSVPYTIHVTLDVRRGDRLIILRVLHVQKPSSSNPVTPLSTIQSQTKTVFNWKTPGLLHPSKITLKGAQ